MKVLTYGHEPTEKKDQAKRIGNRPPFSRTLRKNIQEKADQEARDSTSRDFAQSFFEQRCRTCRATITLDEESRCEKRIQGVGILHRYRLPTPAKGRMDSTPTYLRV